MRSSHNRLAEAIVEGTVTLLRVLLRDRYVSSGTTQELYLEANADPLGLGRTHFNDAIQALLLGEASTGPIPPWPPSGGRRDLLTEARGPKAELQRVRAKRAELKRQLGVSAYTRVRKSALAAYDRLQEESSQVTMYLAETSGEDEDVEKIGVPIGEADNFVAALRQVLDLLILEGRKAQPRQVTLYALRRHQYQLKGTTTGRSLASTVVPEQPRAAESAPVFRARQLELPNRDQMEDVLEEMLGIPLREERQSEILRLSPQQLESLALDHLDCRYGYLGDDRAVEVLDEAGGRVWLLRCGVAH